MRRALLFRGVLPILVGLVLSTVWLGSGDLQARPVGPSVDASLAPAAPSLGPSPTDARSKVGRTGERNTEHRSGKPDRSLLLAVLVAAVLILAALGRPIARGRVTSPPGQDTGVRAPQRAPPSSRLAIS